MATILILGVKVPFTHGGQEVLVGSLRRELAARGHEVDVIELPLKVQPKESLLAQTAIWRSLDLSELGGRKIDLVIATKFPTYYARHRFKSVWLVHQARSIYELYGTRFSDISDDPRDEAMRRMLVEGDRRCIGECGYISTISANVTARLKQFNELQAETLYPPLPLGSRYASAPAEDYVLSVGRICSIKRVDMMLKALPIIHPFVKLKIVGQPDEPAHMQYLKNEIDKHHLWERVEFLGRVSDEALLSLYSKALAVYYAPHDEDYGYVTLEAMASSKPVITATDSGGVLEFVTHEQNGLIVQPTSDAVGHAVNRLVENKDWAAELGMRGRRDIEKSGLMESGWDRIVERLLSPLTAVQVAPEQSLGQ